MERFDVSQYVTVNDRIKQFWKDYPTGRIQTQMIHLDENPDEKNRMVIIQALVFADRESVHPIATGIAKEREGTLHVNKTSFVENCETSAIGRALANLGFLIDKRPSREEMEAVHRAEQEHETNLEAIKTIAKSGTRELQADVKRQWARLKDDPVFAAKYFNEINGFEAVETEE